MFISPAASGRRGFLLGLHTVRAHRPGVTAVPPLLEISAEAHGEQSQHRGRGPTSRLKQLHRVGGTATGRQVRDKSPPDPAPTWLLASPGQTAAGPWQFFSIKQATTGADHTKAVLPARAGVNTAWLQKIVDFRAAHGRCREGTLMEEGQAIKNHPRRGG